jgi:uncharacterized protein (TIGR03435 family)
VQAAPVGLAKTISVVAITKGATAGGSTLALVKGALKVMAWTKAKMTIVVGMSVLLAVGTATITIEKIHQRENNEWQLGQISSRLLEKPPYKTIILPTKSAKRTKQAGSGGMVWVADGRVLGINASVEEILRVVYMAYGEMNPNRVILKTELPKEKFDVLSNLPKGSRAALQQELIKKFGVIGRFETVETNVFLLKVKYPNATGLKPGVAKNRSTDEGNDHFSVVGGRIDDLAKALENNGFKIPIINQTGLTRNYDFEIYWNSPEVLKRVLLDQLGLELVPSREPVAMLVVEKVK